MNSEKITQIVLGGFMAVAVIAGGWFFITSQKTTETKATETNSGNSSTTSSATSAAGSGTSGFSVDKATDPFKTLSLAEGAEALVKTGDLQAFYIGCRNCGHCVNLEKVLKTFLEKNQDKNQNRDLIYKIEAGYSCMPEEDQSDRGDYEKIYQFLVDNGVTKSNGQKAFGTPHFYLIKDGKIVDALDNYDRSEEGLTELFHKNTYRGF